MESNGQELKIDSISVVKLVGKSSYRMVDSTLYLFWAAYSVDYKMWVHLSSYGVSKDGLSSAQEWSLFESRGHRIFKKEPDFDLVNNGLKITINKPYVMTTVIGFSGLFYRKSIKKTLQFMSKL